MMNKYYLVSALLFAHLASSAQSPSTSNVLGASGITAIRSTTNANYQLSVNGTVYQYGTGLSGVTSPSLLLGNTTPTSGRTYSINSSDAGLLRIVDVSASNTERLVISNAGNIGIGNSAPTLRLQIGATSATSGNTIAGVSGLDFTYVASRTTGNSIIPPTIGLGSGAGDLGGLTWFNDGNIVGAGFSTNQRLLWYGFADVNQRYLRLSSPESNFGNFSLEIRNNGSGYPSSNTSWHSKPSTSNIVSWNRGLSIGTFSDGYAPLRLYSDYSTPDKVADIFISGNRVGIGTETPNSNAKLDVNGNIYCTSKIFIGASDGATQARIANYSLAVNGEAIFNKARVKLYSTWADYVFEPDYQLMPISELERFIQTNRHLPGIPSASEIAETGIDLAFTQEQLLKKVEELTLYIIKQQKEIDTIKNLMQKN